MSDAPTRPLTEVERILVQRLVEVRTGVAVKMTLLVGVADLLFFVRMAARSTRRGMSATYVICAAAGSILAMSSDLRVGTARSKVGFLFVRVGLSGADMGACAILPRIIGQGRASDLLLTGRFIDGIEAERWGFYNRLASEDALLADATSLARGLAHGPSVAHAVTKRSLDAEWNMSVDEAIAAEAEAQALCMQTADFARAYRAFVAKKSPEFEGN